MLPELTEFKEFHPLGWHVLIAKDQDDAQSLGGIVIPDKHREYKRRGWVLAVGDGLRVGKHIEKPPYRPGDYVFADRHFARPNEGEDEIAMTNDGVAVLVSGREIWGFVSPENVSGPGLQTEYKAPPDWVRKVIAHFAKGAR